MVSDISSINSSNRISPALSEIAELQETNDQRVLDEAVYRGSRVHHINVIWNRNLTREHCWYLFDKLDDVIYKIFLMNVEAFPQDLLYKLAYNLGNEDIKLLGRYIISHKNASPESKVIVALRLY